MKDRGFSLIELIVVIGIMSTLLAIATLNFRNWQVSRNVERQTREMQADLSDLRIRALHTKMQHTMTLQPNGYEGRSFANAADLVGTVVSTKTLSYPIVKSTGESIAGKIIRFDSRGGATGLLTIRTSEATGASLDCIAISIARTNMGKFANGTCQQQ